MKKSTALFLALLMCVSVFGFAAPAKTSAAEQTTYIGDIYMSRINSQWAEPPGDNNTTLLTSGNELNGLYFDKIVATYDSSKEGYVVQTFVAAHRSLNTTVPENSIGIAVSYQPGCGGCRAEFARRNWAVWQHIRVGDILKIKKGIDLTNKTIDISGTWGEEDFVSNAAIEVYTVRDNAAQKTPFSSKKIVVLGDSVTAGGGWVGRLSERYNCEMINAATPGDRTNEGIRRFDSLVAVEEPDIVFIKFAINDCIQYTVDANTLPNFRANLRALYDKCEVLGATVVFMTTNNIRVEALDKDKFAPFGGLPAYFPQFMQAIRDVAEELDCHCIDLYSAWEGKDVNEYLLDGDTVHPNDAGHDMDLATIYAYLDGHIEEIANKVVTPPAPIAYPTDMDYIPVNDINGTIVKSNSTIWVEGHSGTFNAFYWRAFMCSPNEDGTYTVGTIYECNTKKSITVTGDNILFCICCDYDHYNIAKKIVVGDKLTLVGINISRRSVKPNSHILINYTPPEPPPAPPTPPPTPVVPEDITPAEDTGIVRLGGGSAFGGIEQQSSVDTVLNQFEQSRDVLQVRDKDGKALEDTALVGTGCTVNVVDDDGNVTVSYVLVVFGDLDGNAQIQPNDYAALKKDMKGFGLLQDAPKLAADMNRDGFCSAADIAALKASIIAE